MVSYAAVLLLIVIICIVFSLVLRQQKRAFNACLQNQAKVFRERISYYDQCFSANVKLLKIQEPDITES